MAWGREGYRRGLWGRQGSDAPHWRRRENPTSQDREGRGASGTAPRQALEKKRRESHQDETACTRDPASPQSHPTEGISEESSPAGVDNEDRSHQHART